MTEIELKLAIAPAAVPALVRHPALLAVKRGRARTQKLVTLYFDTDDAMLAQAGVALRLRRAERHWLQSIKGATGAAGGGMSARPEYEWPVARGEPDALRFAATPFRRVLGRAERKGLAPRFATEITRTVVPVAFADSTMAHLAIDRGVVRTADDGPRREAPICEIELELEAGDPLRLFELAHALAADVPLAFEPASKAARGFALRAPVTAAPVRATDPELTHAMPAGAAFATIILACVAQIEGNAQGLVASDDPEWIHQMRIGVRRLRACLSLARKAFAAARVEPLRAELRWLAQALGAARDLDVFTAQTLPLLRQSARAGSTHDLDDALAALDRRARTRRDEARAHARAAVASPRFVRLVLAAAALAAAPAAERGDSRAHPNKLRKPARAMAKRLQKRRHAALLALGHDLAHAAPEARHAARLAAKKLRYATEFFAPLFGRKRTRDYQKALAALQEELGAWNDAAVAARLASELAGPQSPAAAAFAGWAAAQGNERATALADAWQRFVDARPFWTAQH
ncbi:MAG: CYTH and CHAD domain-containing protein [Burkholderiales bacterium]